MLVYAWLNTIPQSDSLVFNLGYVKGGKPLEAPILPRVSLRYRR